MFYFVVLDMKILSHGEIKSTTSTITAAASVFLVHVLSVFFLYTSRIESADQQNNFFNEHSRD